MRFSISKIILWPRDPAKELRVLPFKTTGINVITGWSETGKSSVISIIDYCLGSEKCSIPIGTIRKSVAWYGVEVYHEDNVLLIARKDPDEQQSTADYYFDLGSAGRIPRVVEKNGSWPDIKKLFDQMAKLSGHSIDPDAGFGGRASFRDLAAFNYQPQHIVANPYNLFFKSDTFEHREKLRRVFPLALGAISNDLLSAQAELIAKEQELRRLQREMEVLRSSQRAWFGEAEAFLEKAKELGLVSRRHRAQHDWTIDDYMSVLAPIANSPIAIETLHVPLGVTEEAAKALKEIIHTEEELAIKLETIRRRLYQVSEFRDKEDLYNNALELQSDRLAASGWFEKRIKDNLRILIGDYDIDDLRRSVRIAHEYAENLSAQRSLIDRAPQVDKLRETIRQSAVEIEKELNETRDKRNSLEGEVNEFRLARQQRDSIAIFIGQVSQLIKTLGEASASGERQTKIIDLNRQIARLRLLTDPSLVRNRLEAATETVSRQIEDNSKLLLLEHRNENVTLEPKELTLRFSPVSGRTDYLWEIGSGKNWVGYHISTLLALHEFFSSRDFSPVPSFLIIDQPSQVFFPEATTFDTLDHNDLDESTSRDINEVRKIFKLLEEVCKRCPQLQIIVLEHATSIVWRDLDVNVVANWRDDSDFLIPDSWL